MGCDIHSHAERKVDGKWQSIQGLHPFDWRNYGWYGFLAAVRNYSAIGPIVPPRGVPTDMSAEVREDYLSWEGDAHSGSWLSVVELAAYDYDQIIEDRRVTRNGDGGCTADPCGGLKMGIYILDSLGKKNFATDSDQSIVCHHRRVAESFFYQTEMDQGDYQFSGSDRSGSGRTVCRADRNLNTNRHTSGIGSLGYSAARDFPFCCPKQGEKFFRILKGLAVTKGCNKINLLTGIGRNSHKDCSFLIFGKSSISLLCLSLASFFIGFCRSPFSGGHLFLQRFDIRLAARLGCVCICLALCGGNAIGNVSQCFPTLAVNKGHDFRPSKQRNEDQCGDVKPKIVSDSAFERIPSRQLHKFMPLIIAWFASILFVAKLTWLIAKRKPRS